MSISKSANCEEARRRYAAPALVVYGSVRDLTGGSSGIASDGNDATVANPNKPNASDRSYKENIVQVDLHPAGFGLYLFDYKAELRDDLGHSRKFGVMADEVEKIVPEAVFMDSDGYRKVDYSLLGITLH